LILADTSVWIEHLRSEMKEMRQHLTHGLIVIHPLIIAELATEAEFSGYSIAYPRCEWRI
jgi:predicted nucleic acid-binding protein